MEGVGEGEMTRGVGGIGMALVDGMSDPFFQFIC